MIDYNRVAHSELLKSSNDIDFIVKKATNFQSFQSLINFLEDIVESQNIRNRNKNSFYNANEFHIVDMCSGSGVFGVALAKVLGGKGVIHFVDIIQTSLLLSYNTHPLSLKSYVYIFGSHYLQPQTLDNNYLYYTS